MRFTILSKPIPKARARIMRTGWAYTPKRTKDYEELVKIVARAAMMAGGHKISEAPFKLVIACHGANPRSDWDNLGKAISDALNGIVWVDDSQVLVAMVSKARCPKGQERTEVDVEEL